MSGIHPKNVYANGLWNPFTDTKKWTITCGHCRYSWQDKRPVTELVVAVCPACGTRNEWSFSEFMRAYNEHYFDGPNGGGAN